MRWHPSPWQFMGQGRRLISLEIRPLQHLMEMGIIPVLHGDVVMDEVQGAASCPVTRSYATWGAP
jgi:isopentenyl phosphate kinase